MERVDLGVQFSPPFLHLGDENMELSEVKPATGIGDLIDLNIPLDRSYLRLRGKGWQWFNAIMSYLEDIENATVEWDEELNIWEIKVQLTKKQKDSYNQVATEIPCPRCQPEEYIKAKEI